MRAELDDRLTHDRTGRRLQEPFARSNVELIAGQDHGGERIAENLGGGGIAHAGGNGQDPPGIRANSATVTVTVVNSSPVANNDAFSGPEDSIVTGNVLTNDTDALNASLGTTATYGSLSLNPNGSFTYTPNTNFHGTDTFTYTASNGSTNSNTATVTLTVTPVDRVVFQFNYGTGSQYWTPAARGALEAAASRVSEYIVTATPVTITYDVTGINDPSSGYLAWAGTSVPSTARSLELRAMRSGRLRQQESHLPPEGDGGRPRDGVVEWIPPPTSTPANPASTTTTTPTACSPTPNPRTTSRISHPFCVGFACKRFAPVWRCGFYGSRA